MGLDLYLVDKKEYVDSMRKNLMFEEICYARKCWTIYDFFRERAVGGNDDDEIEIDSSAINDFVNVIKPHYDELVEIKKQLDKIVEDMVLEDKYYALEKRVNALWPNGGSYTLGVEWELHAILKWYDTLKDVNTEFNKHYIICASY